jgi:hypothetical protein
VSFNIITSTYCLLYACDLKGYCRFISKVSLRTPSRREGSLEAFSNSNYLDLLLFSYIVVHPSHFQLEYHCLDRSKSYKIYILYCRKFLYQKGKGFLNIVWLCVAILASKACCFYRYIRSGWRLLAAPKRHTQNFKTRWGSLVAISNPLLSFPSLEVHFFLLFV